MISLVVLGVMGAAAARESIEFARDSLEAVERNLAAKKAVLVDVRSVEEWNRGHVAGALFLPVTTLRKAQFDAERVAKTLPKNKKTTLYTYCMVGMRAKEAALRLRKLGYDVRPLKSGYQELVAAGFKSKVTENGDVAPGPADKATAGGE